MAPQLVLLHTAKLFTLVENKIYDYAGDFTLVSAVPALTERVAVTESINRDLRVSVRGVTCGE